MVFPMAAILIFGIIGASWLFLIHSEVTNGARSGARWAAAESLVQTVGTQTCESGSPFVAAVVADAAPQLKVNTGRLCAVSATQLRQATTAPHAINIVVDAQPSLAHPVTVTVRLAYSAEGLSPPLNTVYAMTADSTAPVYRP
jgi:Flp pilus assembly protein TadG